MSIRALEADTAHTAGHKKWCADVIEAAGDEAQCGYIGGGGETRVRAFVAG